MRISDWSSDVCSSDLDEEAPLGARGRCCAVDIEQRSPLVENRRVGAVEIFRLPVAEDPAAESDDAAAGVVDRDYDAPAKKIVDVAGIGVALHEPELLGILRIDAVERAHQRRWKSEEHTSELQSLMRISYAVFCLTKKQVTTKKS